MPRIETENLIRELRGLSGENRNSIDGLRSRLDLGPPSLGVLQARSDNDLGRRSGALDTRTLLFAIVGVLISVSLLAIALVNVLNRP